MIIDIHAHLGHDYVFNEEFPEEKLLKYYEEYGVDKAIVQPALARPYLEDIRKYHDDVYDLCKRYPSKFYGMASISPIFRPEDVEKEIRRCVNELGFVGIKITPIGHACNPSLPDALKVFELAGELDVPLMIHTGAGAPFSQPINIIKGAELYPNVKIVVAHAGTDAYINETMLLVKYPNVYFEPSWVGTNGTKSLLKAAGADRILFSTDHADNVATELAKYRMIAANVQELDKILYFNAKKLYRI